MSISYYNLLEAAKGKLVPGPQTPAMSRYMDRLKRLHAIQSKTISYNPRHTDDNNKPVREHRRWVENVTGYAGQGLRFVGPAHKVLESRHTGWYADNYQDSLMVGGVWQLPARGTDEQREIYVAGVMDPNNDDCAWIDWDISGTKEHAARWADQMAERMAEEEREYQAKESAKLRQEDIDEEITKLNTQIKALILEMRQTKVLNGLNIKSPIRLALRAQVTAMREQITELEAEKTKLEDDYWSAVA